MEINKDNDNKEKPKASVYPICPVTDKPIINRKDNWKEQTSELLYEDGTFAIVDTHVFSHKAHLPQPHFTHTYQERPYFPKEVLAKIK